MSYAPHERTLRRLSFLCAWALGLSQPLPGFADSMPVVETVVTVNATTKGCPREPARLTTRRLQPEFAKCIRRGRGNSTLTFTGSETGAPSRVSSNGTFKPEVQRCIEERLSKATWPRSATCEVTVQIVAVRKTRWVWIDHDE